MIAQILNTKTGLPIIDQSKTCYFLINKVEEQDDRLKVTEIGYEVLEDIDSVKEIISKYLPLKDNEELCIYTMDEKYIKHWTSNENPSIEDIVNVINVF